MTTSLKTRLLQHFLNKKKEGGFTLIELLVVIIIIGILAAIALPNFLNQAVRARETEAQTNLGSVNRAQQAFLAEFSKFVGSDTKHPDDPDDSAREGFEALDADIGTASDGGDSVYLEYYTFTLPAEAEFEDLDPEGTTVGTTADPSPDEENNVTGELKAAAMRGCVSINGDTAILKSERGDGTEDGVSVPPEACAF